MSVPVNYKFTAALFPEDTTCFSLTKKLALFYYFTFDNAVVDLFIIVNGEVVGVIERYGMVERLNAMERETTLAVEKAALRIKMIESRRLIPEKSRIEMSMAIAEYVITMREVLNARHIHLYLSIPDSGEVSTSAIVDRLIAMKKPLSVPVVRNGELLSATFRKGDLVRTAQFGQPEPVEFSIAEESTLDVVLLPLLAFDERGFRIGYGKGFYDRFLQRLSRQGVAPCRIGLAFFKQKVDAVPVDCCDEALDGVVHEEGIIRFNSNF